MPLENLIGNKYISDLNPAWPDGATDYPDAGDDHIRGIKNVLVKSFPNVNSPITRASASINRGSVPVGSILPFYNAAAPTGWSRVTGITNTYALRIVETANPGGVSGGTDDPILNDKVPTHTHPITGSISGGSHSHSWANGAGTENGFLISLTSQTGSVAGLQGGTNAYVRADGQTAAASHTHTHSLTAGNNTGGASWTPRYMDVILCERTA